jgi:hypothetical protein
MRHCLGRCWWGRMAIVIGTRGGTVCVGIHTVVGMGDAYLQRWAVLLDYGIHSCL